MRKRGVHENIFTGQQILTDWQKKEYRRRREANKVARKSRKRNR